MLTGGSTVVACVTLVVPVGAGPIGDSLSSSAEGPVAEVPAAEVPAAEGFAGQENGV